MCVFIKTLHNSLYCINAKDRKKTNKDKEKVWVPPGRICEGNCCVVKETHSHRYYTLLSTLIQWHFSVQQLDWSTWRYHTVDSLRLIIKCPVISLLALLPALNLHCISSLLVCCCLYSSCCSRLSWCFPCWWRAEDNLPPWRTINIYPTLFYSWMLNCVLGLVDSSISSYSWPIWSSWKWLIFSSARSAPNVTDLPADCSTWLCRVLL